MKKGGRYMNVEGTTLRYICVSYLDSRNTIQLIQSYF